MAKKEKVNPYSNKIRFRFDGEDRVYNPNVETIEEMMPVVKYLNRFDYSNRCKLININESGILGDCEITHYNGIAL